MPRERGPLPDDREAMWEAWRQVQSVRQAVERDLQRMALVVGEWAQEHQGPGQQPVLARPYTGPM